MHAALRIARVARTFDVKVAAIFLRLRHLAWRYVGNGASRVDLAFWEVEDAEAADSAPPTARAASHALVDRLARPWSTQLVLQDEAVVEQAPDAIDHFQF